MSFQRAARTDKGVSAVVNVVSLKMRIDIENLIEKLNSHLPKEIRIFTCIKTTKSFDSKCQCTGRTYIYVLPTYALTPIDRLVKDEFRVTDEILETTSKILQHFKGTHNFHNYTSEIKPNQPQAKRYIRSFECGKPFVIDGTEYVILTVNGQSFIRHHIRKMIGITIAIVRGYCGEEVIEKSWGHKKVDIPKAPGLGLLLRSLEFDGYNRKWGRDGEHKPIEWSKYEEEILKFQDEYILPDIYKTEAEEKVMMQWMQTLVHHVFDYTEDDEGNEIYGRNRFEQKKKGDSADDTVVQVEGEKEDKNAEDVKKRDLDNEKIEESEDSPSVDEMEVKMG
ncbi:hypothetical protein FSP39_020581 [Pinctada imbricata]|uniref:Pseudouridine synthase I TruA alpha/beta domain-containing protein n=1 Tax=Pinctada imbricata TaxID=66713 RepID=A0AA89C4V4_PINIB|nr:hypothetical protein FSP39_020581 [Pinctada imbricata]